MWGIMCTCDCAGILRSLLTTHERDQEMLKELGSEEKPNERVLLAMQWRYLYKKSLVNAVDVTQKVIGRCSE